MSLITKINSSIAKAKELTQCASPNPDLPGIVGLLENMLSGLNDNTEKKNKLAGAVGRLVMEDYYFAESAFGQELLKLADDYAELN